MAPKRTKIPDATARLVLARSGGYCANPSCRQDLFPPVGIEGKVATVGQLAHIIGQSKHGPRGAEPLPLEARNDGSNVILLCSTCHDLIDDVNAADIFTVDVLRQWKLDHERRVRHGAAIPEFAERAELDRAVAPLLRENHGLWRNLGPEGPPGEDPLAEGLPLWRDAVVNRIIPNNRRILELIDANTRLLSADELALVEDFRVHAGALDLNYNTERWLAGTPRFPAGFDEIFTT